MQVRRLLLSVPPFALECAIDPSVPWVEVPQWRCRWISIAPPPVQPVLVAYRCRFESAQLRTFRLHVTADDRYEVFLDGQLLGRGPECGDGQTWFYDCYEVAIAAGEHVLSALVTHFGERRPHGQPHLAHGLLCAPQDDDLADLFGSGIGPWQAVVLDAVMMGPLMRESGTPQMIGPGYAIDLRRWPQEWWNDPALSWGDVRVGEHGNNSNLLNQAKAVHRLRPAQLPAQREHRFADWAVRRVAGDAPATQQAWESLINGRDAILVPPATSCEILFDSRTYLCAYGRLELENGRDARVEMSWAERIPCESGVPAHRDCVDGVFVGQSDKVVSDGHLRVVRLPQWRSGRYLRLRIQTAADPLCLRDLAIMQTGYPLDASAASWDIDDPELDRILLTCVRTLQACAHDTFMDCPHYEQLQYIGDTCVEALCAYCLTPDARLVEKAIAAFLAVRTPSCLPPAAHPSAAGVLIPPFALLLIGMVHQHALWRDNSPLVAGSLPDLRRVVDVFLQDRDDCGLARSPFGWNFLDASIGQVMPGGLPGQVSPLLNWQLVIALRQMEELETAFGAPESAVRYRRWAESMTQALIGGCYEPACGCFANDLARTSFSEHGQVLALLSGLLPPTIREAVERALTERSDIARTGAYFSHYLFEAYRIMNRPDLLQQRLEPWRWALSQGFRAFPEHMSLNTRSDCHAWSAHPLFHFYATLLGIRPADWGFQRVRIMPQPGALRRLVGTLPSPRGDIRLRLERHGQSLEVEVELPPELPGELVWNGQTHPLSFGLSRFRI